MKSRVVRDTAVAAAIIMLLLPVSGFAGLVIGDWESGLDGWIDWGDANATMAGGQTEGVTLGSGSLLVDEAGWGQNLALQLDEPQRAAFMANSIFSIDVSVAETPGFSAGYSQITEVAFNAAGPGWTPVVGSPDPLLNFWWWENRPDETQTLQIDYSGFRDQITDTGYIEIILTTNMGGGAPTQMYFDNAQLIPEPATLGLLGIFGGGLFLTRRHFRI